MPWTFNPFTSNLDYYQSGSGGTPSIPEFTSDPASPSSQEAWVLKTTSGGSAGGDPMGILLSITYPPSSSTVTYQLSYYTLEGTIKRTSLT